MASSLYGIGLSALNAAQLGLATAGHNISNANTAGYSRQRTEQAAATPLFSGSGYLGQGTQVVSISRIYSQFVSNQALEARTQNAAANAYHGAISQLDNLLADTNAGLSPSLQDFFSSVQNLADTPSDPVARAALVSSGQSLVARFHTLDQRLSDVANSVNTQITGSVGEINSAARQIADLNQRILIAQGASGSQAPNDLLDQRDHLVAQLNEQVRGTVVRDTDGSYNVFIGSGQALVIGSQSYRLSAVNDPSDPNRLTLALSSPGNNILLQEASLGGGALGGVLQFRNESLEAARNQLGRVALALAGEFNDQQRLGQDLNGSLGTAFFTLPPAQVIANSNNTGSALIAGTIANAGALTTSDYRLGYDGSNYTLTRLADGVQQTFASLPQTVDGFTLTLASGSAAAGDQYLIHPTAAGAGGINTAFTDPSRLAAAAPIRTAAGASNAGTATISAGSVNGPPPTNVNLQQPVTITFTGSGTFNVTGTGTGNPSGVAFTAGATISYNGWSLTLSGAPQAGDTFTIGPNTGGSADNRNALLLAALQTGKHVGNGTATFQSAYGQLVANVGIKTQDAESTRAAQEVLLTQATTLEQSISGVNLDEEAANLLRYQQAYQAAGKVMQIADTLFKTLLDLGN